MNRVRIPPLALFFLVCLATGMMMLAASSYRQTPRLTFFRALGQSDWNDLGVLRNSLETCQRECSALDSQAASLFHKNLPTTSAENGDKILESFALSVEQILPQLAEANGPISSRLEFLQFGLGLNSLLPSLSASRPGLLVQIGSELEAIGKREDHPPKLYSILISLLHQQGAPKEDTLEKANACLRRFPEYMPCQNEQTSVMKELLRPYCPGAQIRPRIRFHLANAAKEGSFRKSAKFPDGELFYETWPKLDRYHIARIFETGPTQSNGLAGVNIEFTKEGARILAEQTSSPEPKRLAIFFDEIPLIAPSIMGNFQAREVTITFDPAKPLPTSLSLNEICRKVETPTLSPDLSSPATP
jgi:hypothetical protein